MIVIIILIFAAFFLLLTRYLQQKPIIEKFIISDAILHHNELLSHAKAIAKNHDITKRKKNYPFLYNRLKDNYEFILEVYKNLNDNASEHIPLCPASEWLLDNFYIIEEQYKELKMKSNRLNSETVNILNTGTLKGYPRAFAVSLELISHTDGRIEKDQLIEFLDAYQSINLLSTAEIWSLSTMLRFSLIEKIRSVCEKLQKNQLEWEFLHKQSQQSKTPAEVQDTILSHVLAMKELNTSYIEHLLNLVKREDWDTERLLNGIAAKLLEFDTDIDQVVNLEHQEEAGLQMTMGNCITSLRTVNSLDWDELFEKISMLEKLLASDPSGIYPLQDFETRDYYRHRIEILSKRYGVSETWIARMLLKECHHAKDSGYDFKRQHIGFYLMNKNREDNRNRDHNHNYDPFTLRLMKESKHSALLSPKLLQIPRFYISLLILLSSVFSMITLFLASPRLSKIHSPLLIPLFFLFWLPSSDIIISLVHKCITKWKAPSFLPKLDYKNGIPVDCSTIVLLPTLIPSLNRAKELLEQLEIAAIGNYEPNISFVLLGDLPECTDAVCVQDEALLSFLQKGIEKLNKQYAPLPAIPIFHAFIRKRSFHKERGIWTGYERKRGAIAEFAHFLRTQDPTAFHTIGTGPVDCFKARYILTMDADTLLPIGTARRLIGTISHPLCKGVYDDNAGLVTSGYGLIQPRIDLNITSSNKSIFSRVFAGKGGVDTYTNAVSDIYADLFGEGIFTGKGIFDVELYNRSLHRVIPENRVLSHDLLEGSYLRVGLATDLSLIDTFPEKFSSYIMRLHRWTRGDWQLLPWLCPKVLNADHQRIPNPLSTLSKWKIFDNLRRSLVPPSLMLIFILGMLFTPYDMLLWVSFALFTIFLPLIVTFWELMKNSPYWTLHEKLNGNLIYGIKGILYETLLTFLFLPYQSYILVDAILRTLYRMTISKRHLLDWVTASDAELTARNDLFSYIIRMLPPLSIVYLFFIISLVINPGNLVLPLALILLWSTSPFLACKVSKSAEKAVPVVPPESLLSLRRIARKTWRFYEEFASEQEHYLPPDNYQLTPIRRIAHRTSPTNIGLLLSSTLCAYDFGFIPLSSLLHHLTNILGTVQKLEKWNGHLYNWYDTRSLRVLAPKYISTVDSGNFISYLITLRESLVMLEKTELITDASVCGLADTLRTYGRSPELLSIANVDTFEADADRSNSSCLPVFRLKRLLDLCQGIIVNESIDPTQIHNIIHSIQSDYCIFFPLLQEDFQDKMPLELLHSNPWQALDPLLLEAYKHPTLSRLQTLCCSMMEALNGFLTDSPAFQKSSLLVQLLEKLHQQQKQLQELRSSIKSIVLLLDSLIGSTSFQNLYEPKMGLFSIGYNIEENKLTNSYYDLLASESRITSYIATARREVPLSHWFRLGRALVSIDGYKSLVSWTGTMFEYFMPPLIMKVFDNTLLDETYQTVIKAQIQYGKLRNVPWGTSESGFFTFDLMLNYQYKAFGVPELGLKRGLINDMVVSPYSTVLALPFAPAQSLQNINRLLKQGFEGEYGFFEAIDYTPERLQEQAQHAVVESFMAHHQGMMMMALDNFINDNIMIRRFHHSTLIRAGEFLLQERIPMHVLITKEHKERVAPLVKPDFSIPVYTRLIRHNGNLLPDCHLLSNGSYSMMINSNGSSFSHRDEIFLSRWREDLANQNFGSFIFIKNIDTGALWSTFRVPLDDKSSSCSAKFSFDKAEFFRKDGEIETHTEICVSPEDQCEIRKVTLTNNSDNPVILELTSYVEVVLAPLAADVVHPAFSNLFVQLVAFSEYNSLVGSRKPRDENGRTIFGFHTMSHCDSFCGDFEYEGDRQKFIGRGNTLADAIGLKQPLTNSSGAVLDPIMSLRRKIKIEPNRSESVAFISGICDTQELTLDLIKKYSEGYPIHRAFELAYIRSQMSMKYLNLQNKDIEIFDLLLSSLLYVTPQKLKYLDLIRQNRKGQSSLWAYGISGDLPILLVTIENPDHIDVVRKIIKAQHYYRSKGLRADVILLNEEEPSYNAPLQNMLRDLVQNTGSREAGNGGNTFLLNLSQLSPEDVNLFYACSRAVVRAEEGSLKNQLSNVVKPSTIPYLAHPSNLSPFASPQSASVPSAMPNLEFYNSFGGFNTEQNGYTILLNETTNTPAPWINVISNKVFGFTLSERGCGYTWADNSREFKITGWSNDWISDPPSEAVYLRNDQTGKFFSVTPSPVRELEPYQVTHNPGYTEFCHSSNGLKQTELLFVPIENERIKLQLFRIENLTDQDQHLSIYQYINPVLGVSDQFTALTILSEGLNREDCPPLLFSNPYNTDFGSNIVFLSSSLSPHSYTCDRMEFIGELGSPAKPDALVRERLSNHSGTGYYPCGAIQYQVCILPHETAEFVMLLGVGATKDETFALHRKYRSVQNCVDALSRVKAFWSKLLGTVTVKTPEPTMDRLMNSWLCYQTIACRLWARSAFYQSGGAYGFRDQLQDVLSILLHRPEDAREQILLHCAHQFTEGDVQHWWHPGTTSKGIRTRFSDDLLWLPYVLSEYVEKTGDKKILKEQIPFLEEEPLGDNEDERYGIPRISNESGSVFEHCIRAIERSLRFGDRGLPLMGSGDWNDGMNTVGNRGHGESVWMGWFLCSVLSRFSEVCRSMNDLERSRRYLKIADELADYIEKNGWDGHWYRRAYFDDGTPLGSSMNSECRIDSLAQSWAVISGYGNEQRAHEALASVETHLINRECGLILLFTPPFDKGELKPGYIKGYVPGVRENGGQYTHASTWVVMAFARMGMGDKAAEFFRLINPITHTLSSLECNRYKVEPYVMTADVYATASGSHCGRGGWSWYTGSSGWMYKTGLEEILGFHKTGTKLVLSPCIPAAWPEYSIDYRFETSIYHIHISNPKHICKGVEKVFVDGVQKADKVILLTSKKPEIAVEVIMG